MIMLRLQWVRVHSRPVPFNREIQTQIPGTEGHEKAEAEYEEESAKPQRPGMWRVSTLARNPSELQSLTLGTADLGCQRGNISF